MKIANGQNLFDGVKVALGYIDRTAINNTVLKVYLYQIIKL